MQTRKIALFGSRVASPLERCSSGSQARSRKFEHSTAVALLAVAIATSGCAATSRAATPPIGPTAPALVVGTFEDDHGGRHTVSATEWWQGSRTRYQIVMWDTAHRFLIAQNDATNQYDAGKWTRIDWVPLVGMEPYEWAFCFSAYNAASRSAAEGTTIARPDNPKVGCNGYPFSRLRRVER